MRVLLLMALAACAAGVWAGEVTVMRHRLGLSHEEMCAALGVPLGTVKSRLARALTTLRQELKDWDR